MQLIPARDADIPDVVALVNGAYRGDSARQGWTHEADYLDGARIDLQTLRADLAARPDARLLILRDPDRLLGCVWLEPDDATSWYLGMLTVRPGLQNARLGRAMMAQAEAIAADAGAMRMRLTVVSLRDTLIAWYRRRGYAPTGEILPFRHGEPPYPDLTLVVLDKRLHTEGQGSAPNPAGAEMRPAPA